MVSMSVSVEPEITGAIWHRMFIIGWDAQTVPLVDTCLRIGVVQNMYICRIEPPVLIVQALVFLGNNRTRVIEQSKIETMLGSPILIWYIPGTYSPRIWGKLIILTEAFSNEIAERYIISKGRSNDCFPWRAS